jgi:transcriptional regulator with XRE-family HTH domain
MAEATGDEGDVQATDTSRLRELARPAPTLKDLAARAGVSYSLVTKVAAGLRRPNAALRRAVEELYGVPAHFVFGDDVAEPRRRGP